MSLIWGTTGSLGGAVKTFMEGAAHPWQHHTDIQEL